MKITFKITLISPVIISILLLHTGRISAIPLFSRKYKRSCNMCHSYVPKLNEFGMRFKLNAYNLPGTDDDTPLWGSNVPPLGAVLHAVFDYGKNGPRETSSFSGSSIEIFTGGTSGSRLSYFASLEIASVDTDNSNTGSSETDAKTDISQLYGIFNIARGLSGVLNFRFGLFEPLLPFSKKTSLTGNLTEFAAYEIAPAQQGDGYRFGSAQAGASLYGYLYSLGVLYEAAVLNGSNNGTDNNNQKDFYGRLALDIFYLRLGGFYYRGWEENSDDFFRWGADLDINFRLWKFHLSPYALFITGYDSNVAQPGTAGEQKFKFYGITGGLDIGVIPQKLIIFGRYDHVKVTDQSLVLSENNSDLFLGGFQFYFMPNFYASLIYKHQINLIDEFIVSPTSTVYGVTEDNLKMVTVMLNMAF